MPRLLRRGANDEPQPPGTPRWWSRVPWGRVLAAFAVLLVAVVVIAPLRRTAALGLSRAILFVASPLAPEIADFRRLPATTKLLATDGTVLAELSDRRRVPVPLEEIPLHVRRAVLAAEDQDFYHHSGVDPSAVLRGAIRTAQGRTQGGSTITQQLAKINYTASEKTVFRKLREVLYTTRLEERYSKNELLERYLNQVYLGEGAYGIEAAAQTFFGVSAKDLTPAQAAMIAGKIRSPSLLDPRKRPKVVQDRRDGVLASMREQGWLTEAQFREARRQPLGLAPPRPPVGLGKAPHFAEFVKREARTLDALGETPDQRSNLFETGGLRVETTLDPKVFDATVEAVRRHLGEPGDPVTAAATVAPGDGAIRSLFGGLDFVQTQFDMASLGARQPGSAFKPFVYLAGLRDRIDPRSRFDGTSGRVIGCYGSRPVQNYAGEDAGGAISIDDALVGSVNVVFVELGCEAGVRDVLRASRDGGIPEDATEVQGAVFLGGLDKGVNTLHMAAAYASFAARGVYAEPYAIARILDGEGRVVYERKPRTRQAFEPEHVGVLNRPLQRVVTEGTGRAAAIGRPVAGKTGTTQDNVDAWFVGYTSQLATAVWTGFEPPAPMNDVHGRAVTGGSFPAQIFGDLMERAHDGLPVEDLETTSPDELDLRTATSSAPAPAPTRSTPPRSPATTTPTTTIQPPVTQPTRTTAPSTTTTKPPRTTTTKPPRTTTTKPPRTTTTTTAPTTTTTTTTTEPSEQESRSATTTTSSPR